MKKRIGDILMEMGFIDHDQLNMALMETQKTGVMLGDVLRRLDWVTEEDLQMAIAVQSGAQILDTENLLVDQSLPLKIPIEVVNEHGVFPFALEDGVLKVASSNPFDVIARDKLERLTGCRVKTFIARRSWISKRHRSLLQNGPKHRRRYRGDYLFPKRSKRLQRRPDCKPVQSTH